MNLECDLLNPVAVKNVNENQVPTTRGQLVLSLGYGRGREVPDSGKVGAGTLAIR